jgi:hypothetical protein
MLGATAAFGGVASAGGSAGCSNGGCQNNNGQYGSTNHFVETKGTTQCFVTAPGLGRHDCLIIGG